MVIEGLEIFKEHLLIVIKTGDTGNWGIAIKNPFGESKQSFSSLSTCETIEIIDDLKSRINKI